MKIENAFEVPESRAAVWQLLNDVPRVVPCIPGATLTHGGADDEQWQAEFPVTLGPVVMIFDATITREVANEADGVVRLAVKAREKKGRGAATANVESRLEDVAASTRVTVSTDLRLQGTVARMGRSEIVEDVSRQMTDSFAHCLKAKLADGDAAPAASAPEMRITLRTVLSSFLRRFR
ncbi:MAG TPA: SRPBCC family protein [Gaiellaceae bacterium]|nr:SRPBCC family protein [Gaiellaceae bacterium]